MVILHKGKAEIENQIISEEEKHWDINFKFSYYISDLTKKKILTVAFFTYNFVHLHLILCLNYLVLLRTRMRLDY